MAGLVYGTTSQWMNAGIERAKKLKAHEEADEDTRAAADGESEGGRRAEPVVVTESVLAVDAGDADVLSAAEAETHASAGPWARLGRLPIRLRVGRTTLDRRVRAVRRWTPAALGMTALVISAFALAGGETTTQIIKERVVEKPVVHERLLVTQETVEVPVYVTAPAGGSGTVDGTPRAESGSTSTTEAPAASATTTSTVHVPPATTPTTSAPETAAQSSPPATAVGAGGTTVAPQE
jgi:hypothetical protein